MSFKSTSFNLVFPLNALSEITLTIRGPGNLKILSDKFFQENKPYEIYVNDSFLEIKNEFFYNNTDIFIVEVQWNITIKNINNMFENCDNIIEIDLSNFNTSQVTDISCMFYRCLSLSSLNLDNIDTSNVDNMAYMFYNCSSLRSLNLVNFDTSKVITLVGMFYNCISLISLDVSKFSTSKLTSMKNLFYGCKK